MSTDVQGRGVGDHEAMMRELAHHRVGHRAIHITQRPVGGAPQAQPGDGEAEEVTQDRLEARTEEGARGVGGDFHEHARRPLALGRCRGHIAEGGDGPRLQHEGSPASQGPFHVLGRPEMLLDALTKVCQAR